MQVILKKKLNDYFLCLDLSGQTTQPPFIGI